MIENSSQNYAIWLVRHTKKIKEVQSQRDRDAYNITMCIFYLFT